MCYFPSHLLDMRFCAEQVVIVIFFLLFCGTVASDYDCTCTFYVYYLLYVHSTYMAFRDAIFLPLALLRFCCDRIRSPSVSYVQACTYHANPSTPDPPFCCMYAGRNKLIKQKAAQQQAACVCTAAANTQGSSPAAARLIDWLIHSFIFLGLGLQANQTTDDRLRPRPSRIRCPDECRSTAGARQ